MINDNSSRTLWMLLLAGIFLTGCEQNQPAKSLPTQTTVKKYEVATLLHGTVSDDKGHVENGVLNVTNVDGKVIVSSTLQNGKNYRIEVPANTPLPILLSFSADKGQELVAVVIHSAITKYDINPLTTLIAEKAKSAGSYTDSTLRQAAENTSSMSDTGKATAGAQGNPTQRYGGWH